MNNKLYIEYLPEGKLKVKLETNKPAQQMAGHMFVGLLSMGKRRIPYHNELSTLLKVYGLLPFRVNDMAAAGHIMEPQILDHVWGKGTYHSYERCSDYEKGDKYRWGDFKGLIDGKHKTKPIIAEVKCYFSTKKLYGAWDYKTNKHKIEPPIQYILQLKYYMWLYDKLKPKWKIKEGIIMTHYIPFWEAKNPKLKPNNINTFIIPNDNKKEFETLIKLAVERKKKLEKEKEIIVDNDAFTKQILTDLAEVDNVKVNGTKIKLIYKPL